MEFGALGRNVLRLLGGKFLLKIHDLFDLRQKPAVNFAQVKNLINAEIPPAEACRMKNIRSAFGVLNLRVITSRGKMSRSPYTSVPMRHGFPSPPRPLRPISSERKHFCNDSLNVRPIAIASPTDFICVR